MLFWSAATRINHKECRFDLQSEAQRIVDTLSGKRHRFGDVLLSRTLGKRVCGSVYQTGFDQLSDTVEVKLEHAST